MTVKDNLQAQHLVRLYSLYGSFCEKLSLSSSFMDEWEELRVYKYTHMKSESRHSIDETIVFFGPERG